MISSTFRLFVSSTFSDFSEERRLLQSCVFPEIKKYCQQNGLTFQPIDLRWGVSTLAQLDQKTLELCINEVKSSKTNPHPNFLIMLGNRYGWIPLPYVIKKDEYEIILNNIKELEDKELLNNWYVLDENQMPISYILKERKHEYIEYSAWEKVEKRIRNVLQNVIININDISVSEIEKKKYFTSATEAEVIEGIFKYFKLTSFQQDLLKNTKELETLDYENVFAYVRNIVSIDNENFRDNFLDKDSNEINNFKNEIKKSILNENIFDVNVNLKNISQDSKNGSLNYQYETILNNEKSEFVEKMIGYLKSSIDKYIEKLKNISTEELEKYEQERFKKSKLKDFLKGSRKESLMVIDNYINNDNNQSLIVYGKSGLGKSSLMAKSIDNSLLKYPNKKIIYRFVGSTADLNNTPKILISILKELDINEEIKIIKNEQTFQDEPEKIEEFYFRICEHFINIKPEIVIYIDAIDQLSNEDDFLWLPKQLPSNLKIIISALSDENYKEDSEYFENLKSKTTNLYALEIFENSKELINFLLSKYDRTISVSQLEYLENIYKDINTPLYLSVASQEIRHWKSDEIQTLAFSQKEIIKEYILNLSELYHHDKEFITRVFSYIYLTNGLSESELLELLSIDEEFVNYIAPDTFHTNLTKELPVVIWARLYSQIKEFLKLENKNNQETMSFFHREFEDVISQTENTKRASEELVTLLQRLIIKHQYEDFNSNRWGKLYIEVIKKYHLKYEFDLSDSEIIDVPPIIEFFEEQFDDLLLFADYSFLFKSNDILCKEIINDDYLDKFVVYTTSLSKENRNNLALFYIKNSHYISKKLSINSDSWMQTYIIALHNLSSVLAYMGKRNESLNLDIGTSHILLSLYRKYIKEQKDTNWVSVFFLMNTNNRASSLYKLGKVSEAIEIQKNLLNMLVPFDKDDPILIYKYIVSTNNLSNFLYKNGQIDESIYYLNGILNLSKSLHKRNQAEFSKLYSLVLSNLASFLFSNEKNKSLNFFVKAFYITKTFYNKDKRKWIDNYLRRIYNIVNTCKHLNKKTKAIKYQKKYLKELNIIYDKSEKIWVEKYVNALNELATFYISVNIAESIKLEREALNILKSRQCEKDSKEWYQNYKMILYNIILMLKHNGEFFEAKEFEKELLKLDEKAD